MCPKKSMFFKYIFSLFIPIGCVLFRDASWEYIFTALISILMIAIITELLCHHNAWLGYIFNSLTLLIVNIQFSVLFWSNTFLSPTMITNIDSVEALSGKMWQYGITTILVFVFSMLPVSIVKLKKKQIIALGIVCFLMYGVIYAQGLYPNMPNYSLFKMVSQQINRRLFTAEILKEISNDNEFYKSDVADYIDKPACLTESPNIILVFAEGLSQHIIEDERNIMPNTKALQKKSLAFENYYNHTFATYMGLSGQLYSGYQEKNYDPNYLVSLQNVFSQHNYQTTFINTEPKNPEFSKYLKNFDFDKLITESKNLTPVGNYLSDKTAYNLLLKTALNQNKQKNPFFICMYSFGTHVSFDSINEKFGDGKDPVLNKFYDLDCQIGNFIKKFESSPLFENTIIIFTTDHATYGDSDFSRAFPDYQKPAPSLDRIPFLIYHKGISPKQIDVNGRNSLALTPTILDYLDITDDNCFLGTSLFSPYEDKSEFATIYESYGQLFDTSDNTLQNLSIENERAIARQIAKYFAVKLQDENASANYLKKHSLNIAFNPDDFTVKCVAEDANKWDSLDYAIWSEENGQDDLNWYSFPVTTEDPVAENVIMLSNHHSSGVYAVHLYGVKGETKEQIAATNFFVSKNALKNASYLQVNYDASTHTLNTLYTNPRDWDSVRYAVWSAANGQDDLHWFYQENMNSQKTELKISLSEYTDKGLYHVHMYAQKGEEVFKVTGTHFEIK